MSKEALAKVVQRAISDAAFRRQLSTDPAGALRGFDLTADESAAIRGGNAGRLSALGVDQRMSKAFFLGADTANRSADSDVAGSAHPNMISTGTGVGSNADLTGGGADSNALVTGANTADSSALISDPMYSEGHNVLVGYTGTGTIIPADPSNNLQDDALDASTAASSDASGAGGSQQADAWVVDEGHETTIGYQPATGVYADDIARSGTFSGDDIAGPAGGLASDASSGGGQPLADPGDGPDITP